VDQGTLALTVVSARGSLPDGHARPACTLDPDPGPTDLKDLPDI
jgi:hypothetical protein